MTVGESKARENVSKPKKQKTSCLEYFKEKHAKEMDLRREEIELKKREMAIKEKEAASALEIKVKKEERKSVEMELKKICCCWICSILQGNKLLSIFSTVNISVIIYYIHNVNKNCTY